MRRQLYGSPPQKTAQASSFLEEGPVHHMSSLCFRRSLPSVNDATDSERDALMAAWLLAECSKMPLPERLCTVRELGRCRRALGRLRLPSVLRSSKRAMAKAGSTVKKGYRLLCLTDRNYPRLLRQMPDPPLILTVWGQLRVEDGLALAIVGSRRATLYGLDTCRRLSRKLATTGLTDRERTRTRYRCGGAPGRPRRRRSHHRSPRLGHRELVPAEHRRLAERIAANGAIPTEFLPDEPPESPELPEEQPGHHGDDARHTRDRGSPKEWLPRIGTSGTRSEPERLRSTRPHRLQESRGSSRPHSRWRSTGDRRKGRHRGAQTRAKTPIERNRSLRGQASQSRAGRRGALHPRKARRGRAGSPSPWTTRSPHCANWK
jgi:hypothetical protein